jgi:hypothetical protein
MSLPGQIVLKKSVFTSDQNFAEGLVRSSQIYVGDRIANAIATAAAANRQITRNAGASYY